MPPLHVHKFHTLVTSMPSGIVVQAITLSHALHLSKHPNNVVHSKLGFS